jgi:hypothetical protein
MSMPPPGDNTYHPPSHLHKLNCLKTSKKLITRNLQTLRRRSSLLLTLLHNFITSLPIYGSHMNEDQQKLIFINKKGCKTCCPQNCAPMRPLDSPVLFHRPWIEGPGGRRQSPSILWSRARRTLCRQPSLTHSLTHSLMELSPSWEATNCEATKNFPAFYGTRRFITVFTIALHWFLSWARSIQSHPI